MIFTGTGSVKWKFRGKLPKEIESLSSYSLTANKLSDLENALFDAGFQPRDGMQVEEKKEWLLSQASKVYPLCQTCAKRVGERIAAIENATHEQNLRKFRDYSVEYYAQLECFDEVVQALDQFLRTSADSAGVSPAILESVKQDREDLLKLSNTYVRIFSRDFTALPPKELSDLIQQYQMNREKFLVILQRLRGPVLPPDGVPCMLRP
ncbi:MAG: hypothetical protein IPH16_05595 [Haliscomenobacter sp.]|nr:hypothetical protein [Haliscomenobacter sp.]